MTLFREIVNTSAPPAVILILLTVGAVFLSEGIQTRQGVLEYGTRAAHRLRQATLLNLSTNRRGHHLINRRTAGDKKG